MSTKNKTLTRKMNFRANENTALKIESFAGESGMTASDVIREFVEVGLDTIPDLNKHVTERKIKIIEDNLKKNDKLITIANGVNFEAIYDRFEIELIEPELNNGYSIIVINLFVSGERTAKIKVNKDTRIDINNQDILVLTFV